MSTWRYNRMYAAQARTPIVKVEDPTIPTRIDTLLGNGMINEWETNFLNSIKAGYVKYNSLTAGQNDTFVALEKRYDASAIAARDAWRQAWDDTKAKNWQTMMKYYSATPYYRGAVGKWEKNNAYIPSQSEYNDICCNKYSAKYLKNLEIPAKYTVGQLVVYKRYGGHYLATVVEIGEIKNWTKGSRSYKIMLIGAANIETALEKDLLYYRPSMNEKLQKYDNEMPF